MRALLPSVVFATLCACTCGSRPPTMKLLPEGDPCAKGEGWASGVWFGLRGQARLCGHTCASGCDPATQQCTQLGFQRYGCVPKAAGLCLPCETSADCPYPSDACIFIAGQKV